MIRVFITEEQIREQEIRIGGDDAHHLRDVLRLRVGDQVLACTGDDWEYVCGIAEMAEDDLVLRIFDRQKPGRELPAKITLLQCLPKGDKMETVIQKAVELGAAAVVPVVSSRCVVKLDEKRAAAKGKRWNAIARAAAEQSKRMVVPEVRDVATFAQAVTSGGTVRLMPYEGETDMAETRRVLAEIRPGQDISVLIGPEGGFSAEEVERARAAGFQTISLGKRILRTETAGLALLSVLAYLLEE